MDFSTEKIKNSEPICFLELAIKCIVGNSMASTLCSDNLQWHRKSIKAVTENRHFSGKHGHPYPEIALVLDGECFFEFEEKVFPTSLGDIVICQPQLEHCEGILKKSVGYSILWLSASHQAMLATISCYRPGKGWSTPCRWAFRDESVQRLFKRFKEYEIEDILQWYYLTRSDLILILSNLYSQSVNELKFSSKSRKSLLDKHEPILREIKLFIKNHYNQPITLHQLAQSSGMSPNYLNNLFNRHTGQPIHSYIIRLRMEKAAELFRTTDFLVKQVSRAVGYDDPLYFSRAYRKYYGYWPSDEA